jgi:sulfite oxidase
MAISERSLVELYRDDPERADALAFGRRGFLGGAGLATMAAAVGAPIAFADKMPSGLIPAALAQASPQGPRLLNLQGKAQLVLLGDRPLVAETPEHMLDDDTTPIDKFFIRNNGQIPDAPASAEAWKLRIDGEVNTPIELTLAELRQRFPAVSYFMQLECGGNGRSQFVPEARGNQWTNGGMGLARWTGVRLRDVLQAAGPKATATYTAHYGADPHLSGAANQPSISRGVRLAKAMDEHSLIVWAMNDQPLPVVHGGPLRLLVPGWAGSASHKWITRIQLREREHDGPGMTGTNYRVPVIPIVPGSTHDGRGFRILESMPVRSIITSPANGLELPNGTRQIALRGAAWAGDLAVRSVEVSIDYGATWRPANLGQPRNRFDWQRWTAQIALPAQGYYEIWCRATDANGTSQPHVAGNWNPQGYGANAYHRVAVLVKE